MVRRTPALGLFHPLFASLVDCGAPAGALLAFHRWAELLRLKRSHSLTIGIWETSTWSYLYPLSLR